MKSLNLVGYVQKGFSSNFRYELYVKFINGKDKWRAREIETGKVIDITYSQALGYELINPTPVEQLSRKLGKILLPR